MILLAFVSSISGGLRGGVFVYTTTLVSRRMRDKLFASMVRQEIAFFDNSLTGLFIINY